MAQASALKTPPAGKLPVLAIVGRPNVGKSTLFNKLLRERKAIVGDSPGVTRDRNYGEAEWAGKKFQLIDTGGLDTDPNSGLEESVQKQSRLALSEADVILFLLDGKEGLNPSDCDAADLLRRQEKPVFFAVNKIDSRQRSDNLYEFYALGIDPLFSISAEHGLGIPDLMDEIVQQFPSSEIGDKEPEEKKLRLRIAVIGRPNVGKSTLINRLLGFERSVVDSTPGTTRDALDTPFELEGESCVLVDTAGIRRKAKIDDRLERFSVKHSLRSVDRGDLVIYLLDGVEGVTDQDAQILSYAGQRGKALVLAVNKWDLVSKNGADAESYRKEVYYRLSFLDFVPVSFISAATGYGVRGMLRSAGQVLQTYDKKVSTSVMNQALQRIVRAHPAPLVQGKPIKFYYGTQTGTRPPTFTLFVNTPRAIPESYQRYLIHQLRQDLALDYVPIQLILRPRREEQKN
ncbi:MAG TPA: ribosome biogenesis GTPase Der [Candidatus Binatia bacterium]|nr:ribosome biogenesis GTPase Der [Candidatus Binatia bacterium]